MTQLSLLDVKYCEVVKGHCRMVVVFTQRSFQDIHRSQTSSLCLGIFFVIEIYLSE